MFTLFILLIIVTSIKGFMTNTTAVVVMYY